MTRQLNPDALDDLYRVARKILREVDFSDYSEGELKDGSYRMLRRAVEKAEKEIDEEN